MAGGPTEHEQSQDRETQQMWEMEGRALLSGEPKQEVREAAESTAQAQHPRQPHLGGWCSGDDNTTALQTAAV